MKETLKPLLKWFGYTRRERRSSFILVIILVLIITLRYSVPDRSTDFEILPDSTFRYLSAGEPGYYPDHELPSEGPGLLTGSRSPVERRQEAPKRSVQRIDLNSCDSADLERLPCLGPVLSSRIIKYRNILGGFVTVDQLREVYGLSDSAFMVISSRLTADTSVISKIDVNRAGFGDLLRHPYFDQPDVRSILRYRELNGPVNGLDELVRNRIITAEKADRLRPYLIFVQ